MTDRPTLFGMKAEQGRWILVIIGFIVNLCLGTIYAWSVFRKPLEEIFTVNSAKDSLWPFITFLAFFGFLMPFAGPFLDKYGPRLLTIIGGILVGIGWILGSMATGWIQLTLYYGVIAGIGVGIAYNCPIGIAGRWFPDKRGLAVGIAVAGFGLSAAVTGPLAISLIKSNGPLNTMMYLGIAFIAATVLLALPMRFPPKDWKPEGFNPPAGAAPAKGGYSVMEMLKTTSFYGLWLCYIIGTLAGLMAIGIAKDVGNEIFGLKKSSSAIAAFLGVWGMTFFALFNGGGRPIFGFLVDKIGARNSAVVSFVLIMVASLLVGTAKAPDANPVIYLVSFCILWGCLGGWLAIAPAVTASYFGTKNYGPNYGVVFTAYGIGAIIGSLLAGQLKDITGSYSAVFFPYVFTMAIVGIVIAFGLMKPPKAIADPQENQLRELIKSSKS